MLPKAALKHVAAVTAGTGNPALPKIEGFTTMMYAIVTKVVRPAKISVL
jgi:hypothetical protein